MKMIELMGSCGSLVSINPAEILYFYKTKLMEAYGTMIVFKNGKKLIVADDYNNVKRWVKEVQTDD